MARQTDVARTYRWAVAEAWEAGEDVLARVAMAKNTAVAACDRVVDDAVQLHGGLGLHAGIGGGAALPRQPDPRHRWGHERDHDGDRGEAARPLTGRSGDG
jgi:hypothetical protein